MPGSRSALKKEGRSIFLALVTVLSAGSLSLEAHATDTWLNWAKAENSFSLEAMYNNISPPGTASGAVIASPSQSNPDYYYHWIRDAALTMDQVVSLYISTADTNQKTVYKNTLTQYFSFSRQNQLTPNPSGPADGAGLGEPKFNVDGSAFTGNWGRPQNDGPALRAVTLIRWANQLISEGQTQWVRSNLYDGRAPSQTVIKVDLDYVAQHWQDTCIDLWEEVYGHHFFTEMAQRRALIMGSTLANALGDAKSAANYLKQSQALSQALGQYWSSAAGYIGATLNSDGSKDKYSNLDVAVILGSLHGYANDGFYSPGSDAVLITAERLREAFTVGIDEASPIGGTQEYPGYEVNDIEQDAEGGTLGAAIGRYPEDIYNGYSVGNPGGLTGNPWVLATEAFAELMYRAASEWSTAKSVPITAYNLAFLQGIGADHGLKIGDTLTPADPRMKSVLSDIVWAGDNYLRRVRYHANADGSLSEEMNRNNGYMQGADNLTWNYAAFLSALSARPAALAE